MSKKCKTWFWNNWGLTLRLIGTTSALFTVPVVIVLRSSRSTDDAPSRNYPRRHSSLPRRYTFIYAGKFSNFRVRHDRHRPCVCVVPLTRPRRRRRSSTCCTFRAFVCECSAALVCALPASCLLSAAAFRTNTTTKSAISFWLRLTAWECTTHERESASRILRHTQSNAA